MPTTNVPLYVETARRNGPFWQIRIRRIPTGCDYVSWSSHEDYVSWSSHEDETKAIDFALRMARSAEIAHYKLDPSADIQLRVADVIPVKVIRRYEEHDDGTPTTRVMAIGDMTIAELAIVQADEDWANGVHPELGPEVTSDDVKPASERPVDRMTTSPMRPVTSDNPYSPEGLANAPQSSIQYWGLYYRNDDNTLSPCELDGGVFYEAHPTQSRAMESLTWTQKHMRDHHPDQLDRYSIGIVPVGTLVIDPTTDKPCKAGPTTSAPVKAKRETEWFSLSDISTGRHLGYVEAVSDRAAKIKGGKMFPQYYGYIGVRGGVTADELASFWFANNGDQKERDRIAFHRQEAEQAVRQTAQNNLKLAVPLAIEGETFCPSDFYDDDDFSAVWVAVQYCNRIGGLLLHAGNPQFFWSIRHLTSCATIMGKPFSSTLNLSSR